MKTKRGVPAAAMLVAVAASAAPLATDLPSAAHGRARGERLVHRPR